MTTFAVVVTSRVALCGGPDPPSQRFIFGSLFDDESPTKKSILAHTSLRLKKVYSGR